MVIFEEMRPRLLAIAYRMLGSAADAEDVVQETFLRGDHGDDVEVANARGWLVTTLTRLCLDRLARAKTERERYVGPWLPEPIPTNTLGRVERVDDVSLAFLVVLEALSPLERAVFILHEVFEYEHKEIASFLGREEAACRQLLRRAKEHIRERRPRFAVSTDEHANVVRSFVHACESGDITKLRSLLADDVTLTADGGGRVSAASRPVHGADHVARLFIANMPRKRGLEVSVEGVNGKPAIVARHPSGEVEDVIDLVVDERGRVREILAVRNPEKLVYLREKTARPRPSDSE